MALSRHPHLALRLKKEYSYTSIPLPGLRGLYYGALFTFLLVYTGRKD